MKKNLTKTSMLVLCLVTCVFANAQNLAFFPSTVESNNTPPPGKEASKAVDSRLDTWWATSTAAMLTVNFPTTYNVNRVVIKTNGVYRPHYQLECFLNGSWSVVASGTPPGTEWGASTTINFTARDCQKIRLNFPTTAPYSSSNTEFGLTEFEVYGSSKPTGWFSSMYLGGNNYYLPQGYRLGVEGKVIAEEVNVRLRANWPDYVFSNNYVLRPLSEVETYIKKNHHLPEVPSANEIEENGVALGEMNAILLKKVEELTLYIIELEKRLHSVENSK